MRYRAIVADSPAMRRPFAQVDVFTTGPGLGNPLAVVLDGVRARRPTRCSGSRAGRTCPRRRSCCRPRTPGADYRVRIFHPDAELPFAGHPTLGTCHAWLEAGGVPRDPARIVQECGAGLVDVRRDGDVLAFAAPPLLRSGPVDEADLAAIAGALGHRPRRDRRRAVGRQRARLGRRSCSRARRRCSADPARRS